MKDIQGFLNYKIDESGVIHSSHRHGSIRKTSMKRGYLCVGLMKDKRVIWRGVHRLLALAYLPGYFDGACVNHKDGNKLNNSLSNLEWVTPLENSTHAAKSGLYKTLGQHGRARIVLNTQTGIFYDTVTEASYSSQKWNRQNLNKMLSGTDNNTSPFIYA